MPLRVDEQGWKEIGHLQDETLERAEQIAAESARRLANDPGAPEVDMAIAQIGFPTVTPLPPVP
jgi:hypothetical protein